MTIELPDQALALLEAPTVACLSTLMPSGAPHVTPVWIDFDGDFILVNTVAGRRKAMNTRRDPRVGVAMFDPAAPLNWLQIRGQVVEWREDGAAEHLHALSMRYIGTRFPGDDAERVMLVIEPQRASWRFT